MPQFSNLILKDRAGLDVTFKPKDVKAGVAKWVKTTGIPAGDQSVTVSSNDTQNGRRKAIVKLVIPVVQDVLVGNVSRPQVVRTAYAELTLNFDSLSLAQERADITNYAMGCLEWGNTQINPVIIDGDGIY